MAYSDFVRQLGDLRLPFTDRGSNRVEVPYVVPIGRFKGTSITLGFEVPGDFPNSPPGGPHIKPRLLPLNPGASGHPGRVAESPFGPDWEYWSRPYEGWAGSDHSVRSYMAHVRRLFVTQ